MEHIVGEGVGRASAEENRRIQDTVKKALNNDEPVAKQPAP